MINVIGCRLLVKPFKIQEHDKVLASAMKMGLVLPEATERKEQIHVDRGTIVQIGESAHQDYVGSIKVGDTIGYAKYGGKFITDHSTDELFLVINDEDVICVFKDQ